MFHLGIFGQNSPNPMIKNFRNDFEIFNIIISISPDFTKFSVSVFFEFFYQQQQQLIVNNNSLNNKNNNR